MIVVEVCEYQLAIFILCIISPILKLTTPSTVLPREKPVLFHYHNMFIINMGCFCCWLLHTLFIFKISKLQIPKPRGLTTWETFAKSKVYVHTYCIHTLNSL